MDQYKAGIQTREKEVNELLAAGSTFEALEKALEKPPPSKEREVQDAITAIVITVVDAIQEKQISGYVKKLNSRCCDILIKHGFRAMGQGKQCDKFLRFHNLIVQKMGLGSIVRAFVEKRLA